MIREQERLALAAALEARRDEFVDEAVMGATAVGMEGHRPADPRYVTLLPATLSAAYDLLIGSITSAVHQLDPVPSELLAQARAAATAGLSVDELVLRCLAVNSRMTVYMFQEADHVFVSGSQRAELARTQAASFELVMQTVVLEYQRCVRTKVSTKSRRLALVRRLLAGEQLDSADLPYDFGYCHMAVLSSRESTRADLVALAKALDARLLVIEPDDSVIWAWLGTRQEIRGDVAKAVALQTMGPDISAGVGCSEGGLRGWRASHQQAQAAFLLSTWRQSVLHYEDVALEATAHQDHTLTAFLRQRYLAPIKKASCQGSTLIDTLRAYFDADRNGVSASVALNVSRQTVSNRLRLVEQRVGLPLAACSDKIELALRVDELDQVKARQLRETRYALPT